MALEVEIEKGSQVPSAPAARTLVIVHCSGGVISPLDRPSPPALFDDPRQPVDAGRGVAFRITLGLPVQDISPSLGGSGDPSTRLKPHRNGMAP